MLTIIAAAFVHECFDSNRVMILPEPIPEQIAVLIVKRCMKRSHKIIGLKIICFARNFPYNTNHAFNFFRFSLLILSNTDCS